MAKRHAVIDIGSNTVRLVVFTGSPPRQKRLIDEKANCRLAQDIDATGKLSPKGVKRAKAAIAGFLETIRNAKVASLRVIATAAVRDATDGEDFSDWLRKKHSIDVQVLSGDEEARLSAQGVLSDLEKANGIVVDLGGGSLELVQVSEGRIGRTASAPLGHVRVSSIEAAGTLTIDQIVKRGLSTIPWIEGMKGGALYLSGGAWRKMARWHIAKFGSQQKLQGYTLTKDDVLRMARKLSKNSDQPQSLSVAASIITRLISITHPKKVIFSTRGLSDGCLISRDAGDRGRPSPERLM